MTDIRKIKYEISFEETDEMKYLIKEIKRIDNEELESVYENILKSLIKENVKIERVYNG
ncbi:hypothetical protein [Anaerococcus hydrogenalis]|uniref:hypothetical protein n=1 Tax=Anaerococcus hydrogenalis TaxID=33029 RepID=UPI0028FFB2BC|nr:hypothetical protein [Anaerococcus hydrogenalis]MDU1315708.1 hypothetical protein [Anaerococcus hydrogenalis]